ncbi:hypothetical protein KBP30_22000 [Streptomyces sp. Go40/10]|uniref:hypothetical protein n=1 Tax=Streptomyces sp. Go40/10 TaxID=2825844 RepID=UPI001E51962E|nr:hypothetical protein [Streptomyces sp. Go40/10]UFR03671.1 hypothetical protein KBP30_22000 [Streptomyces sp. Go40/10]
MRIRRILAAGIATAALAGLGLTGAATATTGTATTAAPASLTPGECIDGGGTVDRSNLSAAHLPTCKGGKFNGQEVD